MTPGRWCVAAVLVLAAAACVPDPPRLEDAVAPPAASAAPVVAGEGSDAALGRAEQRIAQLEQELREQAAALAAAQSEVDRWRAGLDKCVAKLNEVSADADALAAGAYAPPATPGAPRAAARVSTLSAPRVAMAGDTALVSVRLWNSGDGDASGQVTLELVCGGEVVDSATEYVDVTARTDATASATLATRGRDGPCSGRAHLRF